MSRIEQAAIDWIGRGWLLLLAFTVSVLLVAALRKSCRGMFGTECAFQLWLLPPLAMLASQLPHSSTAPAAALSPLVYMVTSAAVALPAHAATASAFDWRGGIVLLWLGGIAASLSLAGIAQMRYRRRLRDATRINGLQIRWPVWRASSTDVGPALVGAWHGRIVLPADFEHRYDATERALILAHEASHACRRDGCWCLFAQIIAATFWFHPLAWWALAALRHDQELACDAAVLREHGAQRRSYANAMLKTQSAAFALPVGCPWSPRHPITERIAMLKLLPPGRIRRTIGRSALLGLGALVAGGVYASTRTDGSHADHYQLKIELGVGGQPARLHAKACLKPGEYYETLQGGIDPLPPWDARFTVVPAPDGQLEVQAEISGGSAEKPVSPRIRMLPGQTGTIELGRKAGDKNGHAAEDHTMRADLTPGVGC